MRIGVLAIAFNLIIICASIAALWRGAEPGLTLWGSLGCLLLIMIWVRVAEIAEIMREAAERTAHLK